MSAQVVLADPGWDYDGRGLRGCIVNRSGNGMYSQTPMEKLAELDIPAADDALFFCWITLPQLDQALDMIATHWRFEFRGVHLTWHKCTLDGRGSVFGVGSYTASNTEVLCLFTRGTKFQHIRGADLRIDVPMSVHSEKPLLSYWVISDLCRRHGLGTPVEMFARCTTREGWAYALGDQQDTYDGLAEMPHPEYATAPEPRKSGRKRQLTSRGPTHPALTCRPRAPDGSTFTCLVVMTAQLDWLAGYRFDLLLNEHSVVTVACRGPDLARFTRALASTGLEFKTVLFYEVDRNRAEHGLFWFAASPPQSKISKVRKVHRTQIVDVTGQEPFERLASVLRAVRTVFNDVALVHVLAPHQCSVSTVP